MKASADFSKNVSDLLAGMQAILASSPNVLQDQVARASLLQLSRELTASLEQPDELVSNIAFSQGRYMAVRVADDLKLYDLLVQHGSRTAQEMAATTGAEQLLIIRFMRVLVGMGLAGQSDRTTYFPTAATKQMTLASVRAGVRFNFEQGFPICAAAPAYFKRNGYKLPRTMTDGPFQFAFKTKEECFPYWSKQPGVMEGFNTFMQGLFGTPARLKWIDWFPVDQVVLHGYREDVSDFVFVDVAGGKGHEGEAVVKKYPAVQGRFVVEDLPFVINNITNLDPRIERLPYDFRDEQPIKGARTYFLQNVLHNWADSVCQTILQRLREAMIPTYSKLLIANIILPEIHPPLRQVGLDMAMLFLHSGSQRSEPEWTSLLDRAGFNVIKFWHPPGDGDGVIEAELKE
ncbi:MAG: hypothetical protein M1822_000164 [Bathelium mastoideum]|nr:MAG: hypothetical protein M1822_000164 [Bathelium mastoideum]